MIRFLFLLCCMPVLAGDPIAEVLAEKDFHQRLAKIHDLPVNLSLRQQSRLLNWIEAEKSHAVIMNDVVNALRAQRQVTPRLETTLIRIYQDQSCDTVVRDYAVQHLGRLQRVKPAPTIENVLWQGTSETGSSIAGTALLALLEVKADPARLERRALALVRNEGASEFTRIPALRVCGELGVVEAAEMARQLAGNGTTSLRLAAIATLGEVGTSEDLDLLKTMLAEGEPRLMAALERAVGLLEQSHAKRVL